MRLKLAEDIVTNQKLTPVSDYYEARGYLEAIEKARGLVVAISAAILDIAEHDTAPYQCETSDALNYTGDNLKESLAKWDKEK